MPIHPRTPVLIGVGQCVDHWDGADPALAPSPLSLALRAATAALKDTGAATSVSAAIDIVAVVRTNLDSVAGAKPPFPQCASPPRALAEALGVSCRRAIYSMVGGDQPQALVNEFAQAIHAGSAEAVLLAGGEAIAAMKMAARTRTKLDWRCDSAGAMEDRGLGAPLLSPYELANGLGFPTQTYPVFEQALRARLGYGRDAYLQMISELWAAFSKVAEGNPYAQFPRARSPEFLATVSADNYAVADPYLKWHVAQDAVNQGAALILTSVERAQALGVDRSQWIYLHGYAQASDAFVTERADLSRSLAMELVLKRTLQAAEVSIAEVSHVDLYSCFPCAVLIALEILGLDWRAATPTVTGGLPFFGGAGNNYAMHAIATMAETLRRSPGSYGLILANGGFLSKEAAGLYSTTPKDDWRPVSSQDLGAQIKALSAPPPVEGPLAASIGSYTVTYRKGAPQRGYVLASKGDRRILARVRSGHRATLRALALNDPIGRRVDIEHEDGVNYIRAAGRLGAPASGCFLERSFDFVTLERRGHVLEVTLNRPEQMNALHSAAHFELHEIWDEFERDDALWAAIITGAGARAFCSGNDLKATARGADMTTPSSGFAGLCSRKNREKPIIAAVNGVAMGGGLEIVLACDLAVADETAKFALPEVKVGLFAAAGGVQRLTRQIGRKAAMEMILTGKSIGAQEALDMGVINGVAAKGDALATARTLTERVIANSPSAIRASKQALNTLEDIESLHEAMALNGPIFGRLMRTKDFKEGVTAFAEKRTPRWTNS